MPEDDAVEFLNDRGTGVLCLAAERRAYGVPVAFAYDAENDVDEELESWFYTVASDIDVEETDLELQWYELRADEVSGRSLG